MRRRGDGKRFRIRFSLRLFVSSTPRLLPLLCLLLFLPTAASAALPTIDVRPALGDALILNHWQPILVTLKNPDTGAALQGEVQVAMQETTNGGADRSLGTFTAPFSLPRGAGEARIPILVSIPEWGQPELHIYVVNGRGGKGEVVTYRNFDKLPVRGDLLIVVVVSQVPDTLGYLNGKALGVYQANGSLRPATQPRPTKGNSYRNPNSEEEAPIHVQQVTDPADLPGSAVGYDVAGMVYIGADIPPDAFSDTQTEALRRWVAGGGCLVVSGDRLRGSERFRTWLPLSAIPDGSTGGKAAPFVVQRYGRGAVVALRFDPSRPDAPELKQAQRGFWRTIMQAGVALPSVGASIADSRGGYYAYGYMANFLASVMHAPGLQAPGVEAIGLFLLAYLVLVAPINYLVLKRLGRRELAWLTVPVLVAIFSLSAYLFGLRTKGSQVIQNTATVMELGEGTGEGITHAAVGLFSPSRSRYTIRVGTPDAVLWSPEGAASGVVLTEGEREGASLRNTEVSMWAMRTFGVRTSSLSLGQGIQATVKRNDGQISGTVENRTGVRLTKIRIATDSSQAVIAELGPGEKATVRLETKEFDLSANPRSVFTGPPVMPDESRMVTAEETRRAIQADIVQSIDAAVIQQQSKGKDRALISAWNDDALLSVTINGEKPTNGTVVNLILVPVTVR